MGKCCGSLDGVKLDCLVDRGVLVDVVSCRMGESVDLVPRIDGRLAIGDTRSERIILVNVFCGLVS